MKKYDITALGEILIDYTPMPNSKAGMMVFEQNPGGAPANVLACAAKLGLKTAFIGKAGNDMQGVFLKNILSKANIETSGLIMDDNFFTTLAFVSLDEQGDRAFTFARKPGADTQLTIEEINLALIEDSTIFHFGSLSLTDNPAREATHFAVNRAKKSGAIISYDPNYRPLLWKSKENAIEKMTNVLDYVDVIKLSDEEVHLITGKEDLEKAAEFLINKGISIAAFTLGEKGAFVATKEGCAKVPSKKVAAIDTTGAGDAFWGAFLYCLRKSNKTPKEITLSEVIDFTKFANTAAGICVQRRGAIPAMPSPHELTLL